MAQDSIFWTTGATGDGATAYTQAQCIRWLRQTFVGGDNEGVLKDYLNELVATGTSSPVATNTGAAYVHGFPYWSTVSVDTAIPTPSSNTRIDRNVLRANWSAQTVRITRIAGTEGSGTPPSITQIDGTTWDIPLCQASITTGGVITLTDEREFLHPNIGVNTNMLDDLAVTLAKMAADSVDDTKAGNRIPQFYRRQGGSATVWTTYGTTSRTPGAVRMQAGVTRINLGVGEATDDATVTFPVAFSYAPIVFVSLITPGYENTKAAAHSITTTNCSVQVRRPTTTNANDHDIAWLAIGAE